MGEAGSDAQHLGVGIADAITTLLANTGQIAVRPTSAVLRFKDTQVDPARVASTLGVQHLLLGYIQPADHGYRVSLQLVDGDGVVMSGWTIYEPSATLVQLQDRIAEQVVERLRVRLTPPERARLHVRHTDNPAAHDKYLRGRSLLVNFTEAKMHEAIGYFEQALEIDENYALARAGLATASAWFSVRYAHERESLTWGKRAEDEARRALEQDGSLADAHFAIASAAGTEYGGYNWNIVLDRTATALALDPSLDLAHLARMRVYYHVGLFDEVRKEGRLAQALNPGPNVEFERLEIASLLFTGHYNSAVEQATAQLSRTDAPAVRHYLGLARYYAGDGPGARAMLASITRRGRPDVRAQASLASVEAALGMRNEARARVNDILRGWELDHHVTYSVGAALIQLGDLNAGLDWLERAADTGFPCYPWFERDTLLDPLRRHPGFVRLLDRLRDRHEQARRRAQ
jgi:TolB-like protein/Tfp pilus assembly protein PilF